MNDDAERYATEVFVTALHLPLKEARTWASYLARAGLLGEVMQESRPQAPGRHNQPYISIARRKCSGVE